MMAPSSPPFFSLPTLCPSSARPSPCLLDAVAFGTVEGSADFSWKKPPAPGELAVWAPIIAAPDIIIPRLPSLCRPAHPAKAESVLFCLRPAPPVLPMPAFLATASVQPRSTSTASERTAEQNPKTTHGQAKRRLRDNVFDHLAVIVRPAGNRGRCSDGRLGVIEAEQREQRRDADHGCEPC